MNYIYDIVLNFQKHYCNFFEWKREDKVYNIRKIPLYRVRSDILDSFKYDDVNISLEFLDVIKSDSIKSMRIMCLLSDGNMAIGVLFNNKGRVIKRSSMLYDEEDEVCSYVLDFDISDISFSFIKRKKRDNSLRFFKERRRFLFDYLNHINDDMMWKYLYYECYLDEQEDVSFIKKKLYDVIDDGYSDVNRRLYDSIKKICQILN